MFRLAFHNCRDGDPRKLVRIEARGETASWSTRSLDHDAGGGTPGKKKKHTKNRKKHQPKDAKKSRYNGLKQLPKRGTIIEEVHTAVKTRGKIKSRPLSPLFLPTPVVAVCFFRTQFVVVFFLADAAQSHAES